MAFKLMNLKCIKGLNSNCTSIWTKTANVISSLEFKMSLHYIPGSTIIIEWAKITLDIFPPKSVVTPVINAIYNFLCYKIYVFLSEFIFWKFEAQKILKFRDTQEVILFCNISELDV